MKVLVIPEDFRKDQFILKPIIEALFESAGKARAKVVVCKDPLMGGIDQALDWSRLREVLQMWPMIDVYLLCVDRDGQAGRADALTRLEREACQLLPADKLFLGAAATEEVETWALASADLPADWKWTEVRNEVHVKERFFEPLAESRELTEEPGAGRRTLGREAGANYGRAKTLCEELAALEQRIGEWLSKQN